MRPAFSPLPYTRCSHAILKTVQRPSLVQYRFVSSSPPWYSLPPAPETQTTAPNATAQSKGKEKDITQTGSEKTKSDDLPLLQRPLGVRERPKAKMKSWKDTKEKYEDQDKRMEERTHLAREATRGYFADLSATRKHGGKTWIAPKVMIKEDKALYFPDIHGTSLASRSIKIHSTDLLKSKVSVVTLLTTRMSEIQTAQYIEPIQKAFSSNPNYQLVQINLQDNLVKSFLVSLFASGTRKVVPESLWPTYMISNQNMEYLREPLGIANKHVGYVYLVDPNMKIRWAACADPKVEEVEALVTCTHVLLERLAKEQGSLKGPAAGTQSAPAQEQL